MVKKLYFEENLTIWKTVTMYQKKTQVVSNIIWNRAHEILWGVKVMGILKFYLIFSTFSLIYITFQKIS